MYNFYRITINTFKESIREPVFFLMLLSALLMIAHYPSAALFVFSEQLKLVVDSSMATGLLFGLLVAILSASHTVTREMRNGTVLLLLSKPVYRWTFVMGKIFGIGLAVIIFTLLCNLSCVNAVYIATDQFRMDMGIYYAFLGVLGVGCVTGMVANFWRGSSFSEISIYALIIMIPIFTVICYLSKEHPALSLWDLSFALVLINFAVVAMSTLAVVFATRVDTVANLSLCTAIFFLGLVSSYLFQNKTDSELLNALMAVCYAIVPNWQYFWLADAIAVNRPIPFSYVVFCACYVTFYVVICSMWAIALFQNKEVAGDGRL